VIDWLTVRLPVSCYLPGNRVVELTPEGEVINDRNLPIAVEARDHDTRPSWTSTLRITPGDRVQISGNPAKFIQGHNVDGPECPSELLLELLDRIAPALGPQVRLSSVAGVTVSRLDLTHTHQVPEGLNAEAMVAHLAQHGRVERKGRGVHRGHSITFGKATGTTQLVIYDKGKELRAHLPAEGVRAALMTLPDLDRLLRVECRARRKYMDRHGLQQLSAWNAGTLEQLWESAVAGALKVNAMQVSGAKPEDRNGRLFGYVQMWRAGQLPDMARASSYRIRREVLNLYGIDIFTAAPPAEPTGQVICWSDVVNRRNRWKLDPIPRVDGSVISLAGRSHDTAQAG
jgi:II/X family phage/plasmid replication protein